MAKKVTNGLKETSEVVVEKAPVVNKVILNVASEERQDPGHNSRAFK
jgi:hypothetical protein